MSTGLRIALIVIAVVLVVCCLGAVVTYFVVQRAASQVFSSDPARAAIIGHQIADYSLPPGYSEQGGMDLAGIKMVVIAQNRQGQGASADRMAFFLMQFPSSMNLSQQDMERQMSQAIDRQFSRGNEQMQVVGTQQVTIKGQPVTLTVSEGTGSSSGVTHRQVTGFFTGKGGLVMLMAFGPKNAWDQSALDQFLASIR